MWMAAQVPPEHSQMQPPEYDAESLVHLGTECKCLRDTFPWSAAFP